MALWPELLTILIAAGDGFSGWASLNDTIMGGRSSGECVVNSDGLLMQAEVVAEGGGFVSCRSPVWQPPLDLSSATALRLRLQGDGRRYKLAVAVSDLAGRLGDLVPGGLRWVEDFDTQPSGISEVVIPFSDLKPVVRAKPVGFPLRFEAAKVSRLQILHSRFADDGESNPGFRAGPLRLQVLSIEAIQ
ncbi:NADH:ubiquinone oxidoreductase complex I intermediate-associated CIA30-like protein [Synechococcus sp. Minos11]|nr:NADH:ubiquinone oxidoreductase complex I intermediate-associated CIA30-like protein [Synechococcus sp. Minos11]